MSPSLSSLSTQGSALHLAQRKGSVATGGWKKDCDLSLCCPPASQEGGQSIDGSSDMDNMGVGTGVNARDRLSAGADNLLCAQSIDA